MKQATIALLIITGVLLVSFSMLSLNQRVGDLEEAQQKQLELSLTHQAELDMLVSDVYGVEVPSE